MPPKHIREYIEKVEAENVRLHEAVTAVRFLIDNSTGVAGLQLNGDITPWADLQVGGKYEEWLMGFNSVE
jgi:hypothetical protein